MTQNPMEPESGELAAGQSLADLLAKPAFTLTKAALADRASWRNSPRPIY